jgi:hypothetical protein
MAPRLRTYKAPPILQIVLMTSLWVASLAIALGYSTFLAFT